MKTPACYALDTPMGEMGIFSENGLPMRIILARDPGESAAVSTPPPAAVAGLIMAIEEYFLGNDIDHRLVDELIAATATTPFEESVLKEVAGIPRGETASYGEIAERAGYPRAARAVGNVMHSNPFPVIIPCHRVIRSDGGLGGFGGRENLKTWLLEFEGVYIRDGHT